MSPDVFDGISAIVKENGEKIYQCEQVVRLQRQQKAILRQCAPHVRAQRPAALFCLVQPRAPLQLRRISPYPHQDMRTFQMDTGLRRLTLHRFAQRRARDEMVQ